MCMHFTYITHTRHAWRIYRYAGAESRRQNKKPNAYFSKIIHWIIRCRCECRLWLFGIGCCWPPMLGAFVPGNGNGRMQKKKPTKTIFVIGMAWWRRMVVVARVQIAPFTLISIKLLRRSLCVTVYRLFSTRTQRVHGDDCGQGREWKANLREPPPHIESQWIADHAQLIHAGNATLGFVVVLVADRCAGLFCHSLGIRHSDASMFNVRAWRFYYL